MKKHVRLIYFIVLGLIALFIVITSSIDIRNQQIALQRRITTAEQLNIDYRHEIGKLKLEKVQLQKKLIRAKQSLEDAKETLNSVFSDGVWSMRKGIATAYSPFDNVDGNQASGDPNSTSIGLKPSRGVVAVNPRKIPYRSKVMLIYPDGKIHMAIAGDTGGFSRNGLYQVDVFAKTYREAMQHGRQPVLILWQPPKKTP